MMIFRTDTWTLEGMPADFQQELTRFEVPIQDDLPYRTWHVPDSQWSYFILKYPVVQQINREHEIDLGGFGIPNNCWVQSDHTASETPHVDHDLFDQDGFDYEQMEQEQRPFVRRLMTWVCARCEPNLIDLGAGTGMSVEAARGYGWAAQGYDVADPQPRPDLVQCQSLLEVDDPGRTVLCIEVAEHLPESAAWSVIDSVWRNCLPGGLVIWSAAQPGQAGVGHVNCQIPAYWRERAIVKGFRIREDLEQDLHAWITSGYHMGWFAHNRQVWQRPL